MGLDANEFLGVLNESLRRREAANPEDRRPPLNPTRDQFAEWLARRHLASDPGLTRVIDLPGGAPDGEIRLLEVNGLLTEAGAEPIEPLDFSPDSDELPFRVFVAEISPDEWDQIRGGGWAILPSGWSLEGNKVYTRG